MLLFAVSLAMMWAYSLRSDLVYGFDISTEYAVATATIRDGVWEMHPHPDAYGAMLSITVLPAQLHELTGISLVVILSWPTQRRSRCSWWGSTTSPNASCRAAGPPSPRLRAGAGRVSQQLPALARQEIALLLFLALCAALLEIGMPRPPRRTLVVLFGPALVVSHYSTAYFALLMLGGAVCVQILLGVTRRTAAVRWTVAAALLTSVAGAVLWYGPITQSASNMGQLRTALSSDGLQLLPRGQGKGLIAAYLSGGEGGTMPTSEYAEKVRAAYADRSYIRPPGDAGDPRYELRDNGLPEREPRVPLVGPMLNLAVLAFAQLGNLLAVAAAALMVFQRRSPG